MNWHPVPPLNTILPDIFGSGKAKGEETSAKDFSPASASDLSLLSALKLADDVRLQQDSQGAEVNFVGIFLLVRRRTEEVTSEASSEIL